MIQKKVVSKRDNEQLWDDCKAEAISQMGKFSARAMQYAVKLYKERGGGYIGKKSDQNSLVKWTKEDWGYTGEPLHSRYLPKKARLHLTVAGFKKYPCGQRLVAISHNQAPTSA
jgi:hypothetical protein